MTGKLFAGAAASLLLLSGCGSDKVESNNAAELDANSAGGLPLGNDASAMEIVGNQGSGAASLPAPMDGNGTAPSGNASSSRPAGASNPSGTSPSGSASGSGGGGNESRSAPPPARTRNNSAPGGDQGGNSATGNISGI